MTDLAYLLLTVVFFTTVALVARRVADAEPGVPPAPAVPVSSSPRDGGDA